VSLAERMLDVWTNKQDHVWDEEMSKQYRMRSGSPKPKMVKGDDGIPTEMTDPKLEDPVLNPHGYVYEKGAKPLKIVNGNIVWLHFNDAAKKAALDEANEFIKIVQGKKSLKQLSEEDQAIFIRMYSESYHPRSYSVVGPDGSFGENAKNKTGKKDLPVAWGGYSTIRKAISIMSSSEKDSQKRISDALGKQHKVRSFYNNIVDPSSARDMKGINVLYGDVTMDTHAIAALLWLPLGGSSREVSQNFGSANTSNDSKSGLNGLYSANAEAYKRAAVKFGLLPREVQSITWEAVRMLFPATWKANIENVRAARDIWNNYLYGNITAEQAREQIWAISPASRNEDGSRRDLRTATTDDYGVGVPKWWDTVVSERGKDSVQRKTSDKGPLSFAGGDRSGSGIRDGVSGRTDRRRNAASLLPEASRGESSKSIRSAATRTVRSNSSRNGTTSPAYSRDSGGNGNRVRVLENLGVRYVNEWNPSEDLSRVYTEAGISDPKFFEIELGDLNSAAKFAELITVSQRRIEIWRCCRGQGDI